MYYAQVRRGRSLASAASFAALVGCTYDVPGLILNHDAGGHFYAGDTVSSDASALTTEPDAETEGEDGGGAPDATLDATCTDVLCACDNASDCASGICAQSVGVGRSLYSAAGNAGFCSQPCCTSRDCIPGTVCFAGGQGGNYCVSPAWLGRSRPGVGTGGAACTTNEECRSGLCAHGVCADTCCTAVDPGQCARGAACGFGDFPGAVTLDRHFGARCGPRPDAGAPGGDPCRADADCRSGVCIDGSCSEPCHSGADCADGTSCLLDQQGTDVFAGCLQSSGSEAAGSQCTESATCSGGWCDPHGRCTALCFGDDDCIAGWRCAPRPYLLPTGSYVVLGCGP